MTAAVGPGTAEHLAAASHATRGEQDAAFQAGPTRPSASQGGQVGSSSTTPPQGGWWWPHVRAAAVVRQVLPAAAALLVPLLLALGCRWALEAAAAGVHQRSPSSSCTSAFARGWGVPGVVASCVCNPSSLGDLVALALAAACHLPNALSETAWLAALVRRSSATTAPHQQAGRLRWWWTLAWAGCLALTLLLQGVAWLRLGPSTRLLAALLLKAGVLGAQVRGLLQVGPR